MFKVEFDGGDAVEWHATPEGATRCRVDFTPALYVAATVDHLDALAAHLAPDPKVVATGYEQWYRTLQADTRDRVLRVDCERVGELRTLAREIRSLYEHGDYPPGTFRLFNVDFAPQFRYCLATGTEPLPDRPLETFHLGIDEKALADRDVSALAVQGEPLAGAEDAVLRAVQHRIERVDPDVLVCNTAAVVPLLFDAAAAHGLDDFQLGRRPGFDRLAGTSTFESYGRVGHSPARYDVPGRVIVDRANSFLWSQTSLEGLLDLVAHSWKPLQETGWASIGNVLTAIQTRKALARDVLVPLNKCQPERFKDARTLHAADRGGFTFEPDVGLHEGVVEIDFASLYPRIICEYNVSPDTVLCDCHADRADVPELGYNVCDEPGFLGCVLGPLLDDRAAIKEQIRDADDPEAVESLEARSNAIKWILVSCFGYQGYRNSKFGRIECHEAINAVARDVLLRAKEVLEADGWRVVHGIVDSLWVQRLPAEDPAPLAELTHEVSEQVGISLDYEDEYEWVCFVPKRTAENGALTKYFGKVAGADEFKVRGIEGRQRSTPAFVGTAQMDLLRALDRHREPEPVCEVLQRQLRELRSGSVSPTDLVVRQRVSKRREEYTRKTRGVAALARAEHHGVEKHPGEDVRYVVVDDGARRLERVRLAFEDPDGYDADFYAGQLVRAAESVLSPLGWKRRRIRRYLRDTEEIGLAAFE